MTSAAPLSLGTPITIRLAYSPDSDDAFMFWALLHRRVALAGVHFEHERRHTEALNQLAGDAGAEGDASADVVAVSMHQYAYLADRYFLLPHGGSLGVNYGPVVVAHTPRDVSSLRGARIAVPGLRTTAYLVLRLLLDDFEPVVVPIEPYEAVFDALRQHQVDAAVLIHEGRLRFGDYGMSMVVDLGQAWFERHRLPLPLGGNVIRKSLGQARIAQVSDALHASISWALAHRDEVIRAMIASGEARNLRHDPSLLDQYLSMYANHDTLGYDKPAAMGIQLLLDEGYRVGVIPHRTRVQFA
jgi:1,4-dihydroxy-6-naphthoate synthase